MYSIQKIAIGQYLSHMFFIGIICMFTVDIYLVATLGHPNYSDMFQSLPIPSLHGLALWMIIHTTFVLVYNYLAPQTGGIQVYVKSVNNNNRLILKKEGDNLSIINDIADDMEQYEITDDKTNNQ